MSGKKHIQFGLMLHGPGGHMNAWKDESVPADASVNIDYYQEMTKKRNQRVSVLSLWQMAYIFMNIRFLIS